MEKLNEWILYCLRACERAENNKLIWMHQAFGAVQYHITLIPEDYEMVEKLWNKYPSPVLTLVNAGGNDLREEEEAALPIYDSGKDDIQVSMDILEHIDSFEEER